MKIYVLAVLALFCFTLSLESQEKNKLTFEQIFKSAQPKLTKNLPDIQGWLDDDHYIENKIEDKISKLYSIDAITGEEKVYQDLSGYQSVMDSTFDPHNYIEQDEKSRRFLYSKDNELYILDTKTKEFRQLTHSTVKENNPTFSPDGNYIAFTRDNNLFVLDVNTSKEFQITNDASDVAYNGRAAWLYYEEILGRLSKYRAFWWSPDSRRIAFFRFDESKVPVFPIFNSEGVHGSLENTHYPKAGDPNPEVKIGIVNIQQKGVVWADFDSKLDQYFGQPFWTNEGKKLICQWVNRGQDTLILYSVNPENGSKKNIYTEHQKSWVDFFESIYFLKDDNKFIIQSDKDGWSHLYLHSIDGKFINKITDGQWSVAELKLENSGTVLFTARKEKTIKTDFYSINLNGKNLKRLTAGDYSHTVKVSPIGKYFIHTYSNISTPSKMVLCFNDGKIVRELGNSKTVEFEKYEIANTEIFFVKTADGFNLPISWLLPNNFDKNKKYPVLISVYGGPGSYDVYNKWEGLRSQWLAMQVVIQMSIDHRGSVHFGKEGAALMHRNLGKWETNDYSEVSKWLSSQTFIDTTKICITGSSYGGYVACLALTKGADYFTHGVAEFSVTDYCLYDSYYAEKYMDSPDENPNGYKNNSAMTYAEQYKGMLFIVHGTMDDNVHMQNTLQLIDKLENLKKHFELMIYPGGRHGFGGPKATHLRNEAYRFYYKYLLEKEFPEKLFN
jgi:dipeptidyl-peptidase-4